MSRRPNTKSLFLRVHPNTHEALRIQSGRHGTTMSDIVERLLENWLNQVTPAPIWNRDILDLKERVEALEREDRHA